MVATGPAHSAWCAPTLWYAPPAATQYPVGQHMDRPPARPAPPPPRAPPAGRRPARAPPPRPALRRPRGGETPSPRPPARGESFLETPTSLLKKDTPVKRPLYTDPPHANNYVWPRRYVWLRLTGPGRVAIQSAFKHWEDPPEPV